MAVDTRAYEVPDADLGELVATALELAESGGALLAQIVDLSEPDAGFGVTNWQVPAGDLAFVARLDLRNRAAALRSCRQTSERWVVVAQANSLLRHVLRAMVEVERALGSSSRASALALIHASELEIALASRHAYYRFFRATVELETRLSRHELGLVQVLRLCATNVAMLVGRDIYAKLRVEDRHQLGSLRERIFAWMAEDPNDELGARRLWVDVSSTVNLLRGIHRRPVLLEHDLELCARVLQARDLRHLRPKQWRALIEASDRDERLHASLTGPEPSFAKAERRLGLVHDQLAQALGRPARAHDLPSATANSGTSEP